MTIVLKNSMETLDKSVHWDPTSPVVPFLGQYQDSIRCKTQRNMLKREYHRRCDQLHFKFQFELDANLEVSDTIEVTRALVDYPMPISLEGLNNYLSMLFKHQMKRQVDYDRLPKRDLNDGGRYDAASQSPDSVVLAHLYSVNRENAVFVPSNFFLEQVKDCEIPVTSGECIASTLQLNRTNAAIDPDHVIGKATNIRVEGDQLIGSIELTDQACIDAMNNSDVRFSIYSRVKVNMSSDVTVKTIMEPMAVGIFPDHKDAGPVDDVADATVTAYGGATDA